MEKEVHSVGTLLTLTCRMGIAKAPVLPEPVCARPMTSLPTAKSTIASGLPSDIDLINNRCNLRGKVQAYLQADAGLPVPVCWWAPSIPGQQQTLRAAYRSQAFRIV